MLQKLTLHQLLFRAFHGQNNYLQPTLDELSLGRGQPRILNYLEKNGDSSQSEIASYFSVDPASVSRMAETLRKNGFITREEDSSCRRSNRLSITDKGRDAIKIWREKSDEVEEIMLSGFSEEEKERLKDYLIRIIENYKREEGDE